MLSKTAKEVSSNAQVRQDRPLPQKPSAWRRFKSAFRRQWMFYTMMIPGLALIALFCYVPMPGVALAFKDYKPALGIWGSEWIDPWYKNFEFFFKSDTAARVTFNTIFYNVLQLVLVMGCAIALAIMFFEIKNKYLSGFYKGAILLPTFLSWIIVQYIFYSLLSADRGIVNGILEMLGKEPKDWYGTPLYWRFIMPAAYLWKNIGYYSVFYIAAIAGINTDFYEAAQLDGASKWQQIKYLTIPLLRPTVIILSLLWIGKVFSGGFGDWNGFLSAPNESTLLYPATDVIDTYVFRALKDLHDYGMSSAVGLYQAVVGFVMVLLSNWIIKKLDPESAMF